MSALVSFTRGVAVGSAGQARGAFMLLNLRAGAADASVQSAADTRAARCGAATQVPVTNTLVWRISLCP
ncbi:hypothetical protein MOKP4_36250 [Mycobacterium avium subsp. hominissuis]|nr:hypothetical protein MAH_0906 [Mycobacterium avium subsp. hominissuis TH135]